MSRSLSRAQAEIRAVLANSPRPDDARHAEDTLAWLLRLRPGVTPALALAALGHDIDGAAAAVPLRTADFTDDSAFRNAHAARAAAILRRLLDDCGVIAAVTDRACWLVEHHECGGDADADLLRDADKLSCFRVRLAGWLEREGAVEALRHCRHAYACLSPAARRLCAGIRHDDPRLRQLMKGALLPKSA